jgi:hypothetical protein
MLFFVSVKIIIPAQLKPKGITAQGQTPELAGNKKTVKKIYRFYKIHM